MRPFGLIAYKKGQCMNRTELAHRYPDCNEALLELADDALERLTILDNPLVAHKVTLLRDKNTSSATFRRLVKELTYLEAYPATATLPTIPTTVETPLAPTEGVSLTEVAPTVVPILRAGLAMADAISDIIPMAPVAHLGMFRDEQTHEPLVYYGKFPHDLGKRPVMVVDPMLATGGSMLEALAELRKRGAQQIIVMVLVASPQGVVRVLTQDPDCLLYVCALDQGLNKQAYIVPGLGDAGDRIFETEGALLDSSLYKNACQ